MKKLLLFLSLTIVTMVAIAQTVHYTRTGSKYHSGGCRYLSRSDYECSLQEALNMGLSACSRCSPPTQVIVKKSKPKPKPKVKTKIPKTPKVSYINNMYNWFPSTTAVCK